MLWTVYTDYSLQQWYHDERWDYAERTRDLAYPVLMINSFVEDVKRPYGGAYVFWCGEIILALALGKMGILSCKPE